MLNQHHHVTVLHFTLILQRSDIDLTEFQFSFCFVKSVLRCEIWYISDFL